MPTNLVLMKESKKVAELSKELGFSKCMFLDKDFVLVKNDNKKELLKKINQAKDKGLLVVVKPESEELLRFVLERTKADLIYAQEFICPKDSVHFLRGGLDQVTCKIARDKGKTIGFSFKEILNAENKGKLLARMKFNIKLCRKYKVKLFFSNFSEGVMGMRSAKDLASLWEVLGGIGKKDLEL